MTSGLVDGLTSATSGLVDNSGCLSVTVRHWQCPYIGPQAPVSVACSDDLISYQKFDSFRVWDDLQLSSSMNGDNEEM